jgi:flagellar assembly protein FliH
VTYRSSLLLFADDFAAPPPPPPVPALPEPSPPPSYGQDELDAAIVEAQAQGHAKGLADAAAATEARVADTLATIAERLADAAASAARVTGESADAIARLVLGAVLAGYPLLGERHGLEEVRWLLRRTLPGLLAEPRVTFRVHPSMVPAIGEVLATVPHDERRHMTIERSDAIPPGDARITWPHGGAIRNIADTVKAIEDILRPYGLLPEPDGTDADAEMR